MSNGTLLVATAGQAVMRSADDGHTWHRLGLRQALDDPAAPNVVYAGADIGLCVSRDTGNTCERVDSRLLYDFHTDIHSIHVLPNHGKKTVVVVFVNAVYRSTDEGATWTGMLPNDAYGLYYALPLAALRGSEATLYLSISDGTPGTTSKILVTHVAAQTWEVQPLPQQPNSCIWAIAVNPSNPQQHIAGTKYGHLFTSTNGGRGWQRHWRDFSEITDVAWSPEVARSRLRTSRSPPTPEGMAWN